MRRGFRLTRSNDFKRVRRSGKSYAHPLIVLYALKTENTRSRVGVTAGTTVGNAVRRNRAKRLMREAMRALYPEISPGNDLMLIARTSLADSDLEQTRIALTGLLRRAGLIAPTHVD